MKGQFFGFTVFVLLLMPAQVSLAGGALEPEASGADHLVFDLGPVEALLRLFEEEIRDHISRGKCPLTKG